jgi:hypothetical protein
MSFIQGSMKPLVFVQNVGHHLNGGRQHSQRKSIEAVRIIQDVITMKEATGLRLSQGLIIIEL